MKPSLIFMFIIFLACSDSKKTEDVNSFKNIGGNKIHFKIEGEGKEIVMVHGGYLDLDMWQLQVDEFKDDWKIIRFSDLGHGKTISSGQPIFGYDIIGELSNATSDNPTVLMGLSWGAMICIDFALNHPQKVEKLILVSPGLSGWDYFQDSIAGKNYQLRQIATANNKISKSAELFHQNWVVGPRRSKEDINNEFFNSSLEVIKKNMKEHWQQEWSELDTIPAIKRLDQIKVPTYIIIGNHDGEDIKMIAETYEKLIPNSKIIIIEDVAHLINLENALEFNKLLREILNEN